MRYLEELSVTEAEKLKKTILSLLRQTCILREKYDPVTLAPSGNEQYETCIRHREFICQYLDVIGCELLHDPQECIFRVVGEGLETERISRTTTIIMLLIKMIYHDKIMGNGLAATVTNLEEIREYGKNSNLLNEKLATSEWSEALWMMKKHQMIEYPGAVRELEDHTPIYIYSTIHLYFSSAMVNELLENYKEEEENGAGEEIIPQDAVE